MSLFVFLRYIQCCTDGFRHHPRPFLVGMHLIGKQLRLTVHRRMKVDDRQLVLLRHLLYFRNYTTNDDAIIDIIALQMIRFRWIAEVNLRMRRKCLECID